MTDDKRLADMFIPPEERLTELEMQPNFPFPIETTIIIAKDNWQFVKNHWSKTSGMKMPLSEWFLITLRIPRAIQTTSQRLVEF